MTYFKRVGELISTVGLKEIFPPTPYRTATVRGRKISFVDPVDVIKELFGRLKDLSDIKFEYESGGGDIDHPCRAKRFRQCHRYVRPALVFVQAFPSSTVTFRSGT
jgi:hypothetical protein